MTEKPGQAPNHWPPPDFLRAMSALLVLSGHTRAQFFFKPYMPEQPGFFSKLFYFMTGLQHEAVVIFFVLSGFLIGGSLVDSMQRGSFDLVRYLIARFVRIYIVFIPALVITEAVFLFHSILLSDPGAGHIRPLFSEQPMDIGGVSGAICHLAGLQGFSCHAWDHNRALWSLGYEWALYLIAPAIIGLIVWEASPGLRLIAIALVCVIAATLCGGPENPNDPMGGCFGSSLGSSASPPTAFCVLGSSRSRRGLLGAGVIIAGMAIARFKIASVLETDMIVAAGTAIAIACRPLVEFPFAPRLFGWAAGFSYTLYAIHFPLVYFIADIFQNIGFPRDQVPPSPRAFMEFGVTIAICLLAAFLVSLVTERKTGRVRAAMLRMCPLRPHRKAEYTG